MKIQFLESNSSEKRLIEYLRSVKEDSGEDIKTQISKIVMASYDVYAIGDNPDCTQADLEKAMLRCWNVLSTHLAEVALYGKNHKYNVSLSYPHVVLIDSMALSHLPAVTSQPSIAESVPIVRQEPDRQTIVEEKKEIDEDHDDDDDDDDDDPYEGMSDEEYLAATAHLSYIPEVKY